MKKFAEKNKIDVVVMGESLEKTAQQNMIHRFKKKGMKNINFEIVPISE